MNKAVFASLALLFSSGLLFPCINASCQETPESTKHLIENLQPDQQLTQQQRDELNAEAMKSLARYKNKYDQQQKEADKEAIKFEKGIKVTVGKITEKDQQVIDKLTQGVLVTPKIKQQLFCKFIVSYFG